MLVGLIAGIIVLAVLFPIFFVQEKRKARLAAAAHAAAMAQYHIDWAQYEKDLAAHNAQNV